MIQSWELTMYQPSAEEMARRLGDQPHEMVVDRTGQYIPRWVEYATKMHELRTMLDLMRQNGIPL